MEYEFFVYILECSDGAYYVGITNDIERRLSEHQRGMHETSFTFERRPVELVYSQIFHDVWEAIGWEKQLKGWSRNKKEALIKGEFELLPELAESSYAKRIRGMQRQFSNHLAIIVILSPTKNDNAPRHASTSSA